jgi:hypothetical protein
LRIVVVDEFQEACKLNSEQAPPIAPETPPTAAEDDSRPTFDRAAVHAHVSMLHELARGAQVDGVLVLACYGENPQTGRKVGSTVEHFAIGDVECMTASVMCKEGRDHLNVYIPWHIMRRDLAAGARGGLNDLRAVLALPVDLDSDTGKAGELPLKPQYVIETSADNSQPVYVFDRALSPEEAQPIAEALWEATGGDSGTKDLAHVWRVPGTINWPNKKKVGRGRPLAPLPVKVAAAWAGELIAPEMLQEALAKYHKPGPGSGATSNTNADWHPAWRALPSALQTLIRDGVPEGERSETFHRAVGWL